MCAGVALRGGARWVTAPTPATDGALRALASRSPFFVPLQSSFILEAREICLVGGGPRGASATAMRAASAREKIWKVFATAAAGTWEATNTAVGGALAPPLPALLLRLLSGRAASSGSAGAITAPVSADSATVRDGGASASTSGRGGSPREAQPSAAGAPRGPRAGGAEQKGPRAGGAELKGAVHIITQGCQMVRTPARAAARTAAQAPPSPHSRLAQGHARTMQHSRGRSAAAHARALPPVIIFPSGCSRRVPNCRTCLTLNWWRAS